jgi:hypothetical protein
MNARMKTTLITAGTLTANLALLSGTALGAGVSQQAMTSHAAPPACTIAHTPMAIGDAYRLPNGHEVICTDAGLIPWPRHP